MKILKTDVAVLGAGTAGLTARRAAEKAGARTLLLDPGPLGTTCARTGCMPSKLLIAAAETARSIGQASLFGLDAGLRIDTRKVMERVRSERDRFTASVLPTIEALRKSGIFLQEAAYFLDEKTLQAQSCRIEAKAIIVAAGSEAVIPEPYREFPELLLTHESFFELEELPSSVLVAGAGPIGLELGQALRHLGVHVTVLGLGGRIGGLRDPKIRAAADEIFRSDFSFFPDHRLTGLRRVEGGVEVSWQDGKGARHKDRFSRVLLAAGRRPALQKLRLENAGLSLNEKGRPDFDPGTCQAGNSSIFLAGDVNGFRPVLHEAAFEGRLAGENAARFPEVRRTARKTPLEIIFTEPQIARIGQPAADIPCEELCTAEIDYSKQGRSQVMGLNRGMARLYGSRKTRCITGAELVAPRGEHLAHLLAFAIDRGLTVDDFLDLPFYHPVFEEGLHTAARQLKGAFEEKSLGKSPCDEFGPGY